MKEKIRLLWHSWFLRIWSIKCEVFLLWTLGSQLSQKITFLAVIKPWAWSPALCGCHGTHTLLIPVLKRVTAGIWKSSLDVKMLQWPAWQTEFHLWEEENRLLQVVLWYLLHIHCVCMHTHTITNTHKHTNTHTSTQTHKHTSTQTIFQRTYLFYVCEYTVTVFRHTRRGHQLPS